MYTGLKYKEYPENSSQLFVLDFKNAIFYLHSEQILKIFLTIVIMIWIWPQYCSVLYITAAGIWEKI